MQNSREERKELMEALHSMLIRDDGVTSLVTLLHHTDDGISNIDKIGHIITTPPVSIPINEYFPKIVNQLLVQSSSESRILLSAFVNRYLRAGRKIVLDVLFKPFAEFVRCCLDDTRGDSLFATADEIQKALNDLIPMLECSSNESNMVNQGMDYLIAIISLYEYSIKVLDQVLQSRTLKIISMLCKSTRFADSLIKVASASESSSKCMICDFPEGPSFVIDSQKRIAPFALSTIISILRQLGDKHVIGEVFVKLSEKVHQQLELTSIFYCNFLILVLSLGDALLYTPEQTWSFLKICLYDSKREILVIGLTLLINNLISTNGYGITGYTLKAADQEDIYRRVNLLLNHEDTSISTLAQSASLHLINQGKVDPSLMLFKQAITDLGSEMVPIRACGLNALQSLVEQGTMVAEVNMESIVSIFLTALADDDSYIYTNAMQGLVQFLRKDHCISLRILLNEYMDETNEVDFRCRVGEVLFQSTKSKSRHEDYLNELLSSVLTVVSQNSLVGMSGFGLAIALVDSNLSYPQVEKLFDLTIESLYSFSESSAGALSAISAILNRYKDRLGVRRLKKLKWTLERIESCNDLNVRNQSNYIWTKYFS